MDGLAVSPDQAADAVEAVDDGGEDEAPEELAGDTGEDAERVHLAVDSFRIGEVAGPLLLDVGAGFPVFANASRDVGGIDLDVSEEVGGGDLGRLRPAEEGSALRVFLPGPIERGHPGVCAKGEVGVSGQEGGDDVALAGGSGNHERGVGALVAHIEVGTGRDQSLSDLAAVMGGKAYRRCVVAVIRVI